MRIRVALLAWLAMLGIDFLLNGAVFARIYQDGGSFMLGPADLFRRIPVGYVAFLIAAFGLVELALRFRVTGVAGGLRLGLVTGAIAGSVWALSLYSIATVTAPVALAFFVIWLVLVVVGATVAAAGLGLASLRGLVLRVVAADIVCVVIVVGLQSLGVVPTTTP